MNALAFQSFRAELTGQAAIRAAALRIANTNLSCNDSIEAYVAVGIIEQEYDSPDYLIKLRDYRLLVSIVRYIRQVDTVPATIATDNSPQWDTSRDKVDTDLILSATDRHNIGLAFAEYHGDMRRAAYSYYRRSQGYQTTGETSAILRASDAADWAVSEAYSYAIEQVGRGSLDPVKLFEVSTWFGIIRTIRGRYFDSIKIMSAPREEVTLESIVGPGYLAYEDAALTDSQLDYVLGIDDATPDWAIDTIAALLASPDGTDDERAALLKIRPAAYRKRLQRTREYFATRA